MIQMVIFQSLGGLGMFLFGMKIMSEGLQKFAGKKMRQSSVCAVDPNLILFDMLSFASLLLCGL